MSRYTSDYMSTAYGPRPWGRFSGAALREEIQADIDRARARIRRHVPYHPSYVPRCDYDRQPLRPTSYLQRQYSSREHWLAPQYSLVFEIAGMWRSAQAPSEFWRGVAPPHYYGTASRRPLCLEKYPYDYRYIPRTRI